MTIQRRPRAAKVDAPEAWPEPDENSVSALRSLCVDRPYFVDVAEKVLMHASWQPGERIEIKRLAEELGISAGLCSRFFGDLASIGAGRASSLRPQLDDKVLYDRFTWHVDFDAMIRRAVA